MRLIMLAIASFFLLQACDQKGPAEEMGEKIDKSMDDAADAVEDAADEVEDEVDDATH
jgi:hypothetical protein